MDKNTITGILLIGAILLGFTWFNRPSEEELRKQEEAKAKIAQIEKEKAEANNNNASNTASTNIQIDDSTAIVEKAPYLIAQAENLSTLSNDVLELKVSNRGAMPVFAKLKKYSNQDSSNVVLFNNQEELYVNFPLRSNQNTIINTADSYFDKVESTDSTLTMRMRFNSEAYLDVKYHLPKDDYRLKMSISGKNLAQILPTNMSQQDIEWNQKIRQQEQSWKYELQYAGIYYHYPNGDVEHSDLSNIEPKSINDRTKWFAFKDKYFSTTLILNNQSFTHSKIEGHSIEEGSGYVAEAKYKGVFDYTAKDGESIDFTWLIAPNHYDLLSDYATSTIEGQDLEFQHLVYLGASIFRTINQYLVIPIVTFLNKYISNWGIIILLLTLFIKLLLSPLTYKSYRSQAKMRVLRPQVEEINQKYAGDDREMMMKRQTETMNLYRSAGASPMSGCLPMLVQMPFLIALYMYFPTSILLRGESFLWAKDLSTYDPIISWSGDIPFVTSMLGNHISLFCLLMTITNVVYNKYMMDQNAASGQQGMQGMKMMPYIMSIMFFFFFNNNASGLCYYYFISTLITILQYFFFRYTIDEKKILAEMEENKKKPKKKSSWQQRLEEAQKMQREMQKQRNKK